MPKKKIKVKVEGPKPESGILKAKIPASLTGTQIAFPHRHMANVDTGISVKVANGYRLCFAVVPELAAKGMVAANAPGNFRDGKVFVTLLNCGREIVIVKDGDPLVHTWIAEDIDLEWE